MSRYIDAERLKQILKPREWGTPDERWVPEHEIGAMLDYFPAADVAEVRHGHWNGVNKNKYYDDEATCSICGVTFASGYSDPSWWNYCPNCGASMDEEVNK